ncbi:MAG: Holliday junction DNA helicase RuvA [Deltaproteobacteria bacterium GWA2_38_16]|nr:MAG: Holliday junction DNA helicase RuvA [Deltaproteobacteria bacterium GWA2_38_16]OGQ02141.1 MAG: Holliday junction DNA helicase RuvA [Deltaproteobacteria bacterium RIFCSPHIGHO2_02_FULL_38_15]OGQ60571.1 MAG: Holliday junction DNA helicase RuvA [Deltaproteobacteria bacterium RIFCSPLOWO2_12_FULL_38_8]
MIGQLKGNVVFKKTDKVTVDVHGVGYEITIPSSTFYKLPEIENAVHLYIHTHVREDNIQLFGFLTAGEKEFFQLLMTVSGVGPKVALSVISEISPQELATVILTSNIQRLSSIQGIGKKTAERLVLELKEKIKKLSSVIVATDTVSDSQVIHDLVSALSNLGYKQVEIDRALSQVRSRINEKSKFEELLKQSLHFLRA